MKKFIALFFVCLFLNSCYTTENDSKESCIENCTTFSGQIRTVDGIGISKVKLTLGYHIGQELSSYTRIIGKATTDQNGFYEMSVFIKDNELGEGSPGYFTLALDPEKINNSLPDEYLKPNAIFDMKPEVIYYSIIDRNEILENDFIIPKKGNVKIKLKNFTPIVDGDYFNARGFYNYTFLSGNWSYIRPYNGIYIEAKENPSILNFKAVLNDTIRVNVSKKKNGVVENYQEKIVLDNPNVYELELEY